MADIISDKPKYKGPDETITSLGQSTYDGYVGSLVGLGVGGVAGAFMHNKGKHEAVKAAVEQAAKGNRVVEQELKAVTKTEGLRHMLWHGLGRTGKIVTMALAGALAIGAITNITGAFRGKAKAKEAREQFDQITTENEVLKHKLDAAEEQIVQTKSFVESLKTERGKEPAATPTASR